MANNKVVLRNGTTLIDLSQDTVTSASHILRGHTGHLADGSQVSGAADYSVTYSMSDGAYATSTPVRVISGEGFTSKIKVPAGYALQGITVTMGGVDITNSAVEYEEIVKDLITHAITYNLSNSISSNISPSEILDNEGLFLKLSAPSGYNLSGVSVTMGSVDITSQVFEYDEDSGGGITPTGTKTISITQNGTTTEDVANYASAQISVNVPSSSPSLQSKSVSYTPSETAQNATVTADNGYDGLSSVAVSVGAVSNTYVGTGVTRQAAKTVTPTESSQTAVASGVYTTGAVTVGAVSNTYVGSSISRNDSSDLTASGATVSVPAGYYASSASKSVASGTAGTPTATKGAVSNHSISVTPSVTNTTGYISGGTKTGTAVTVTASELVSGSETKTANGTYDVTNLSELVINVPSSGSTKNVQYYMGVDYVQASSYTATDVTLTVAKTGTYTVSWIGWRSTSSGTSGSQLYKNNTAYGTATTTFTGTYGQSVKQTGVSLNQGDVLVVRARSRNSSYYMYVGNLIIEETS